MGDKTDSNVLYSPDSSIDGAVLQVVLRKAEAIRKATGVTVPLPEERSAVAGALLNALLLRKGRSEQLRLDLGIELSADTDEVDRRWRDAEEGERRSRAVFAQNTLRPDEVIPEWQRWQTLLGGPEDVRRFLARAMGRLNAGLEPLSGGIELAHLEALPPTVLERLAARGLQGTLRVTFQEPAPPNAEVVVRSHPLPSTLADFLLESALQPSETTGRSLGRCGVWATKDVSSQTFVLLMRLRFKLFVHGRQEKLLLVEEAGVLAFTGNADVPTHVGDEAFELLRSPATENLAAVAQERIVRQALTRTVVRSLFWDYSERRTKQLHELAHSLQSRLAHSKACGGAFPSPAPLLSKRHLEGDIDGKDRLNCSQFAHCYRGAALRCRCPE
jgi:Arc/MetJ family transcription regulator